MDREVLRRDAKKYVVKIIEDCSSSSVSEIADDMISEIMCPAHDWCTEFGAIVVHLNRKASREGRIVISSRRRSAYVHHVVDTMGPLIQGLIGMYIVLLSLLYDKTVRLLAHSSSKGMGDYCVPWVLTQLIPQTDVDAMTTMIETTNQTI
mgnify:CR=1 FL=1